jgi:hypothetical protein
MKPGLSFGQISGRALILPVPAEQDRSLLVVVRRERAELA